MREDGRRSCKCGHGLSLGFVLLLVLIICSPEVYHLLVERVVFDLEVLGLG